MALGSGNIQIDVGARGFEDDIVRQVNEAQRRIQPIRVTLDDKGFRQPLGRITGDLSEFQNSLDASVARTLAFGAAVGVINSVANAFKGMINSASEVEKKLTDVNVILNLNSQSLRKFSDDLFSVAKNTGTAFETVSDAAVELARQGLGAQETLKRINDAMILTRLSGMDAAKSVETLTAAINGFGSAALSTTEIVNKLASVDAAFAVSTDDLANALSRAGATAQAAKVSMDELLGAVTSVQQSTARGGAVIGNAFKSIFTRIQRSSVREQLESIGVATTDAAGNIRNAMSILQDYARVYKNLSDGQRAYTDELVAGVFQINNLRALVKDLGSDFSIYGRAVDQSSKATDEAIRRNRALDKTLAALINKSMVSVKELASTLGTVLTGPAVKNVLNVFNSISDALTKALDPEKGNKLIQGIFKGISNFISGPGLLLLAAGFIKIFKFITGQSLKAVKEVFKIKNTTDQIANTEAKLSVILQRNKELYSAITSESLSHAEKEKLVLEVIKAENAALAQQEALIRRLASSRNVSQTINTPNTARGYVPNYARNVQGAIAAEKEAISNGVGGASKSAKPKVLNNFPMGGGKRETIVANTDEVIAPNFKGGTGSAILNRDMMSEMNVPKNARPVAKGYIPNYNVAGKGKIQGLGRDTTIYDKELYQGRQLSVSYLASGDGGVAAGPQIFKNLLRELSTAAAQGRPYTEIDAGSVVGPRIPTVFVKAKRILDNKRAKGEKIPFLEVNGVLNPPAALLEKLARFKSEQEDSDNPLDITNSQYQTGEEKELIKSLKTLGLDPTSDKIVMLDTVPMLRKFAGGYIPNMALPPGMAEMQADVDRWSNERGGFANLPATSSGRGMGFSSRRDPGAPMSEQDYKKLSYSSKGGSLNLGAFFPSSGSFAIGTLFKDVMARAKAGDPYSEVYAGEIVGPRIPKMIVTAKKFLDKKRRSGLRQPPMAIDGNFRPYELFNTLRRNKGIYEGAEKKAAQAGEKFKPSAPGKGIAKVSLASKYVPKEEQSLMKSLLAMGLSRANMNNVDKLGGGFREDEKFALSSLPLFATGFAGGFIPSFLDVYRGIKVPRGATPNVDDVFRGGASSVGKFRPSEIYSIPQLQDYLQAHAQSALGTGLVSSSTNRKTAESFATTSDPTKRGVVGRKSMSHKRMYNPRKVEKLVKFLMARRQMSERDAVQWFVKQAKNKPIGFDVKRWLNDLDAKQFGKEQEIAILNKSSFDTNDYARGFIPNLIFGSPEGSDSLVRFSNQSKNSLPQLKEGRAVTIERAVRRYKTLRNAKNADPIDVFRATIQAEHQGATRGQFNSRAKALYGDGTLNKTWLNAIQQGNIKADPSKVASYQTNAQNIAKQKKLPPNPQNVKKLAELEKNQIFTIQGIIGELDAAAAANSKVSQNNSFFDLVDGREVKTVKSLQAGDILRKAVNQFLSTKNIRNEKLDNIDLGTKKVVLPSDTKLIGKSLAGGFIPNFATNWNAVTQQYMASSDFPAIKPKLGQTPLGAILGSGTSGSFNLMSKIGSGPLKGAQAALQSFGGIIPLKDLGVIGPDGKPPPPSAGISAGAYLTGNKKSSISANFLGSSIYEASDNPKEAEKFVGKKIFDFMQPGLTSLAEFAYRQFVPGQAGALEGQKIDAARYLDGGTQGGLIEGAIRWGSDVLSKSFGKEESSTAAWDFTATGNVPAPTNKTFFDNRAAVAEAKRNKTAASSGDGSLLSKTVRSILAGGPQEVFGLLGNSLEEKIFAEASSSEGPSKGLSKFANRLANKQNVSSSGRGKKGRAAAGGFIPNFVNALEDAIVREKEALDAEGSSADIYVDSDARLKGSKNPTGLLVANTRDEPLSGSQGVDRVLSAGMNPKTAGMKGAMAHGYIPSFYNSVVSMGTGFVPNFRGGGSGLSRLLSNAQPGALSRSTRAAQRNVTAVTDQAKATTRGTTALKINTAATSKSNKGFFARQKALAKEQGLMSYANNSIQQFNWKLFQLEAGLQLVNGITEKLFGFTIPTFTDALGYVSDVWNGVNRDLVDAAEESAKALEEQIGAMSQTGEAVDRFISDATKLNEALNKGDMGAAASQFRTLMDSLDGVKGIDPSAVGAVVDALGDTEAFKKASQDLKDSVEEGKAMLEVSQDLTALGGAIQELGDNADEVAELLDKEADSIKGMAAKVAKTLSPEQLEKAAKGFGQVTLNAGNAFDELSKAGPVFDDLSESTKKQLKASPQLALAYAKQQQAQIRLRNELNKLTKEFERLSQPLGPLGPALKDLGNALNDAAKATAFATSMLEKQAIAEQEMAKMRAESSGVSTQEERIQADAGVASRQAEFTGANRIEAILDDAMSQIVSGTTAGATGVIKTTDDSGKAINQDLVRIMEGVRNGGLTTAEKVTALNEAMKGGNKEQKEALQASIDEIKKVDEDVRKAKQEANINAQKQLEQLKAQNRLSMETVLISADNLNAIDGLRDFRGSDRQSGVGERRDNASRLNDAVKALKDIPFASLTEGFKDLSVMARKETGMSNMQSTFMAATGIEVQADSIEEFDAKMQRLVNSGVIENLGNDIEGATEAQKRAMRAAAEAMIEATSRYAEMDRIDPTGKTSAAAMEKDRVSQLSINEASLGELSAAINAGLDEGLQGLLKLPENLMAVFSGDADKVKEFADRGAEINEANARAQATNKKALETVREGIKKASMELLEASGTTKSAADKTMAAAETFERAANILSKIEWPGTEAAPADSGGGNAGGFIPNYSPSEGVARAVSAEKAMGGRRPVVDSHPSVGTYVRDAASQPNFAAVRRDHPEGMKAATKNSAIIQGAKAAGFIPNYSEFNSVYLSNLADKDKELKAGLQAMFQRGGPELEGDLANVDEILGKDFRATLGKNYKLDFSIGVGNFLTGSMPSSTLMALEDLARPDGLIDEDSIAMMTPSIVGTAAQTYFHLNRQKQIDEFLEGPFKQIPNISKEAFSKLTPSGFDSLYKTFDPGALVAPALTKSMQNRAAMAFLKGRLGVDKIFTGPEGGANPEFLKFLDIRFSEFTDAIPFFGSTGRDNFSDKTFKLPWWADALIALMDIFTVASLVALPFTGGGSSATMIAAQAGKAALKKIGTKGLQNLSKKGLQKGAKKGAQKVFRKDGTEVDFSKLPKLTKEATDEIGDKVTKEAVKGTASAADDTIIKEGVKAGADAGLLKTALGKGGSALGKSKEVAANILKNPKVAKAIPYGLTAAELYAWMEAEAALDEGSMQSFEAIKAGGEAQKAIIENVIKEQMLTNLNESIIPALGVDQFKNLAADQQQIMSADAAFADADFIEKIGAGNLLPAGFMGNLQQLWNEGFMATVASTLGIKNIIPNVEAAKKRALAAPEGTPQKFTLKQAEQFASSNGGAIGLKLGNIGVKDGAMGMWNTLVKPGASLGGANALAGYNAMKYLASFVGDDLITFTSGITSGGTGGTDMELDPAAADAFLSMANAGFILDAAFAEKYALKGEAVRSGKPAGGQNPEMYFPLGLEPGASGRTGAVGLTGAPGTYSVPMIKEIMDTATKARQKISEDQKGLDDWKKLNKDKDTSNTKIEAAAGQKYINDKKSLAEKIKERGAKMLHAITQIFFGEDPVTTSLLRQSFVSHPKKVTDSLEVENYSNLGVPSSMDRLRMFAQTKRHMGEIEVPNNTDPSTAAEETLTQLRSKLSFGGVPYSDIIRDVTSTYFSPDLSTALTDIDPAGFVDTVQSIKDYFESEDNKLFASPEKAKKDASLLAGGVSRAQLLTPDPKLETQKNVLAGIIGKADGFENDAQKIVDADAKKAEEQAAKDLASAENIRDMRYSALRGIYEENVRGGQGDEGAERTRLQQMIEAAKPNHDRYRDRLNTLMFGDQGTVKMLQKVKKQKSDALRRNPDINTSTYDGEISFYDTYTKLLNDKLNIYNNAPDGGNVESLADFLYRDKGNPYKIAGKVASGGTINTPHRALPNAAEEFRKKVETYFLDVGGEGAFKNIGDNTKKGIREMVGGEGLGQGLNLDQFLKLTGGSTEAEKEYAKVAIHDANKSAGGVFQTEFEAADERGQIAMLKKLGIEVPEMGKGGSGDKGGPEVSLAKGPGTFPYFISELVKSADEGKKQSIFAALSGTAEGDNEHTGMGPMEGILNMLGKSAFSALNDKMVSILDPRHLTPKRFDVKAFSNNEPDVLYNNLVKFVQGAIGGRKFENRPEGAVGELWDAVEAAAENGEFLQNKLLKSDVGYILHHPDNFNAFKAQFLLDEEKAGIPNAENWKDYFTNYMGPEGAFNKNAANYGNLSEGVSKYGPIPWQADPILTEEQQAALEKFPGATYESAARAVYGNNLLNPMSPVISNLIDSGGKSFYADLLGVEDDQGAASTFLEKLKAISTTYYPYGYDPNWLGERPAGLNDPKLWGSLVKKMPPPGVDPNDAKEAVAVTASGFVPNFSAVAGEMQASRDAGYQKAVTASQVKSINIPGHGKSTYNTQESVIRGKGMRQPFIVPPANSKAAGAYGAAVQNKFGFNPYARASGFVPNLAPGEELSESVKEIAESLTSFTDALTTTNTQFGEAVTSLQNISTSLADNTDGGAGGTIEGAAELSGAISNLVGEVKSLTAGGISLNNTESLESLANALAAVQVDVKVDDVKVDVNVAGAGAVETAVKNAFQSNLSNVISSQLKAAAATIENSIRQSMGLPPK